MIQKLTLMSLCVSIAMSSNAQHQLLQLKPEQAKQLHTSNSMMRNNPSSRKTHHKPTAIKQRLIAQAITAAEGIDSFHYSYSGSKGSTYNYNRIFEIGYSTEFWPDLGSAFTYPDEIPSDDVLASSINTFYAEEDPEESMAYYNTSGKLDSATTTSGSNTRKISVQYDGTGHTILFNQEVYSGSTFGGGSRRKISYTGSEIATDSVFYWSGSSWMLDVYREYTYNAEGQIEKMTEKSGMGEAAHYLYQFRYDAAGRLRATETTLVMGLTSIPQTADTIGYTDGVDYVTFYQQVYHGDMPMAFRTIQYPGANDGPDSVKIDMLDEDVWLNEGIGYFTYNEFGNPEKLEVTAGVADPEDLIGMVRFHYETYDDGISSNDDVALDKDFAVFPNPFNSNLTIVYKGSDKESVQILLSDISGRTIFSGTKQLQKGDNNIQLPQLPAGTYLLSIKNRHGKSFTQKVIHQ